MFDAFADSFDENLSELGYRAPQLLAEAVAEKLGAQIESGRAESGQVEMERGGLDILDAGCGTGLCGPLLKSMARTLVGVDISPGMLEKARARNLYDELAAEELSIFMRQRPASADLIVSADTLVYFGALEEPLSAAHGCLRDGGLLAFTLERLQPELDTHQAEPKSDEPKLDTHQKEPELDTHAGYRIEPHGRYSHHESYIRAVLADAGFSAVSIRGDTLRREASRQVAGHVVLAVK
jgi:predicted TPR repeat methyltransferase